MSVAILALAVVACDQKPEPREASKSEKEAVGKIVGQIQVLEKLATDPASANADNLKKSIDFEPYQSLISPLRLGALRNGPREDFQADCVTLDMAMTSATINCTFEGHSVTGSVAKSGDTVTADVTDAFTVDGDTGSANVKANVTLTSTSLDGSIMVAASATGSQGDTSVNASVTFDAITLDSMFCPTAGSLVLSGKAKVRGSESPELTITIGFGPSCGDITKS